MAPARKTATAKAADAAEPDQTGNVITPDDTLADLSKEDKAKVAAATSGDAPETDDKTFNLNESRTDSDRPFVTSDRFSVAQVEIRGREDVAISTVNHVGPAELVIRRSELPELIKVLTALDKAKAPKAPEEGEDA